MAQAKPRTSEKSQGRREKVTRVTGSDTFETASRKRAVCLANVNAPEKRQPGYQDAKRSLMKLIGGRTVSVDTVARDRYGRSVANVKVGRRSVNAAMRRITTRSKRDMELGILIKRRAPALKELEKH